MAAGNIDKIDIIAGSCLSMLRAIKMQKSMELKNESLSSINDAYSAQYAAYDAAWRTEGAKNKAENIISLCSDLKAGNMLDIGSGDGSVLAYLSGTGFIDEISSIDVSDTAIQRLKDRKIPHVIQAEVFDGYHIPFPDKKYKLATCSHVMEHVEHPRLILREIGRVSEYQFFEIPIDFSFFVDRKLDHFLSYGHINIFTPALFRFLLKSEGFDIVKEDFRFYSTEGLRLSFPNRRKRLINTLKNKVVSSIPFLKKIKPNIYVVLCRKSERNLKIF